MATANVFMLTEISGFNVAEYCIAGMHVFAVNDQGILFGTRRKVTPCDGTCKAYETVKELEFSETALAELETLLDNSEEEASLKHKFCKEPGDYIRNRFARLVEDRDTLR